MVVVLVAVLAFTVGLWSRRWWLLALPPAAAGGAALLLALPGTHVDADNPLVFLLLLTEILLGAGVTLGRRRLPRSNVAA